MRVRSMLLIFAVCCVTVAICAAADSPMMGTWKLDEAKSKMPAGGPKNDKVVYEMAGDQIKVTVDGTDGSGAATHSEWTGKFDGKDYPVTGDPNGDTRAYKQVNDHTVTFITKKGGKTTVTGRVVVSADGKTRTVTIGGTDADGKKVHGTAVYDKQ